MVLVRTASPRQFYNLCFKQIYENYQSFLSENFQFLEVKFSIYLNRRVFVMKSGKSIKRTFSWNFYSFPFILSVQGPVVQS